MTRGPNPYAHVTGYLADSLACEVARVVRKAGAPVPATTITRETCASPGGLARLPAGTLAARGVALDGGSYRLLTAYEAACVEARRQIGCPCGLGEHAPPCPLAVAT